MNRYIILIALVLLLGHSCHTVKECSEIQQRYEATEKRHFTVQWNHYDSTGRYWHFQSDSLFYYHNKIIDIAKDKIFEGDKTISEITYELGFKYPQHFSRLFKQRVGFTPNDYRNLN